MKTADRTHRKQPKIQNWKNMLRDIRFSEDPDYRPPTLNYRMKLKLHGTNASITIFPDGSIQAQSRTRLLGPGRNGKGFSDNAGFAGFVESIRHHISKPLTYSSVVTIFGEWIGPGIQKKVACSRIPAKAFCIFAIRTESVISEYVRYVADPELIRQYFTPDFLDHPQIKIIPWYTLSDGCDGIKIDLETVGDEPEFLKDLEKEVASIDAVDPWVLEEWGISGHGEGLVLYPMRDDGTVRTDAMFKVKGESHQVVDKKRVREANRNPATKQKAMILISALCTPARLEQGWKEACSEMDLPKNPLAYMSALMPWLSTDVQTECAAEISESGLDWTRDLARPCGTIARQWLIQNKTNMS